MYGFLRLWLFYRDSFHWKSRVSCFYYAHFTWWFSLNWPLQSLESSLLNPVNCTATSIPISHSPCSGADQIYSQEHRRTYSCLTFPRFLKLAPPWSFTSVVFTWPIEWVSGSRRVKGRADNQNVLSLSLRGAPLQFVSCSSRPQRPRAQYWAHMAWGICAGKPASLHATTHDVSQMKSLASPCNRISLLEDCQQIQEKLYSMCMVIELVKSRQNNMRAEAYNNC